MPKNVQTTTQLHSFHMLARYCSKTFKCGKQEIPDVQAGFREGRGTRNQLAKSVDHRKSRRIPGKHLFLFH